MRKPKAILFDYDGVLADTMTDNFHAWKFAFGKYKVKINKNDYFLLEGMSTREIAYNLGKNFKLDPSLYPKIIKLKEDFYLKHNSFKLYPGVYGTIKKLKKYGIKLGLVSGASEKRLLQITPSKFLSLFDVIIHADKINNSKPHPEPYQKAIRSLHIPVSSAVAVENAPLGIKSAKSAGLYCVALTTTLGKKILIEADLILNSVNKILNLL